MPSPLQQRLLRHEKSLSGKSHNSVFQFLYWPLDFLQVVNDKMKPHAVLCWVPSLGFQSRLTVSACCIVVQGFVSV